LNPQLRSVGLTPSCATPRRSAGERERPERSCGILLPRSARSGALAAQLRIFLHPQHKRRSARDADFVSSQRGCPNRIGTAAPDANDPSHFTAAYSIDDVRGTIEGWLRDDGTLDVAVRDGPFAGDEDANERSRAARTTRQSPVSVPPRPPARASPLRGSEHPAKRQAAIEGERKRGKRLTDCISSGAARRWVWSRSRLSDRLTVRTFAPDRMVRLFPLRCWYACFPRSRP
jgi:hypothetical protein